MLDSYGLDYNALAKELFAFVQANPAVVEQWKQVLDPTVWATESFAHVIKSVYTFLPEQKATLHFTTGPVKRTAEASEADCSFASC